MSMSYAFVPLLIVIFLVILPAIAVGWLWANRQRRRAQGWGYGTLAEYLRAVPLSDDEKKASIDMALQGLVICVIAVLIPPLLFLGVFPLFYGLRKISYSYMGLGLIDELDQ